MFPYCDVVTSHFHLDVLQKNTVLHVQYVVLEGVEIKTAGLQIVLWVGTSWWRQSNCEDGGLGTEAEREAGHRAKGGSHVVDPFCRSHEPLALTPAILSHRVETLRMDDDHRIQTHRVLQRTFVVRYYPAQEQRDTSSPCCMLWGCEWDNREPGISNGRRPAAR